VEEVEEAQRGSIQGGEDDGVLAGAAFELHCAMLQLRVGVDRVGEVPRWPSTKEEYREVGLRG
jgi:hypothetical protein